MAALGIVVTALWIVWAIAVLRIVLQILEHARFISRGVAQLTGLQPPVEKRRRTIDPTAGIRAQSRRQGQGSG